VTLSIYAAVVAWLYTIGVMLSIVQDSGFQRILQNNRFTRSVRRIVDPFYLICGYGDTGSLLVRELAEHGIASVVIDIDQERIDALNIDDLRIYTPGVCADAGDSDVLEDAGLEHRHCRGVVTLIKDEQISLKIAITCKLIRPALPVICRAETDDGEANLASVDTDYIVNPYKAFAERFAMMFHSPSMYLIHEWVTSIHDEPLIDYQVPPQGMWLICGFGRFGRALRRQLNFEGVESRIIDNNPELTHPPAGSVLGRATEAGALQEAEIHKAVGIIAATNNDPDNLSIIITARQLNPKLFVVCRQNERKNKPIFSAARLDGLMQPSTILARHILALIMTPGLSDFLSHARKHDDNWANVLVSRIGGVLSDSPPEIWSLIVSQAEAPAIADLLDEGEQPTVGELCTNPHDRSRPLGCVPLLLQRGGATTLLPENARTLHLGDCLLFCGTEDAMDDMLWTASNFNVLSYVRTGRDRSSGLLWRWLARQS
jgi:Trk K+ transport system NAD-binding subunit